MVLLVTLAALLAGGQTALAPSRAFAAEAAPAQRLSDHLLDPAAHARVTYEGSVNIGSFQQDVLLTVDNLQYTSWYREDGTVVVSRRTLPGGTWQSLELDGRLAANDSHNTISMAVSPSDGRLHLALGTHTGAQLYVKSVPDIATAAWTSRSFEAVVRVLPFTNPGGTGNTGLWTYPQFEVNRGQLLLTYREGITHAGEQTLVRYNGDAAGTWTYLGRFTDSTGTWTGPYGSSSSRYSYLHGFGTNPVTGDLEISFSWRERAGWCNSGGLGNHDLGYARSSDGGLTWTDDSGRVTGRTGTSDRISVRDPHVVVPISINRGLINQEAQTFDSQGRVHVMTSQFNDADLAAIGGCHTSTYSQRAQYAKPFHHWRDAQGTWRSMELPFYSNSAGRTKLLFDAQDTAWVVLPDGRVVTATAASTWSDWQLAFSDPAADPLAELVVDRTRLQRDGVLSMAYLQVGDGIRGGFRVTDLRTGPGATGADAQRDTTPQPAPVDYTGSLVPAPTATASTSQPAYPASLAVDGRASTFWVSSGTTEGQGPQPTRPETLTVTYGQSASTAQAIGSVTVTPRVGYGPRSLRIEALVNGAWTTLGTYEMPNAAATFDTPDVLARQLRLVVTAAYDNGRAPAAARNVQVAEVSVRAPV
ncbi:hypothetical protein ASG41_09790 [Modestobacter sp. Leaf380]|nr:hypothetical protein ASG41_09790 [Modestobacter sp. Leaf380]